MKSTVCREDEPNQGRQCSSHGSKRPGISPQVLRSHVL
ncbi:hypothetical protein ASZ90_017725 [hydrocarbon metagenome]|uniref:Uncharacterized protein n=1 Tax=hydrocarbon metagenome TaxID=938273 RepID=A0A0W8E8R2_9ZZZZ